MKKIIFSIKDFIIISKMIDREIYSFEGFGGYNLDASEEEITREKLENAKRLETNNHYQDLLRLRERLNALNIEVETPDVKIKGETKNE